jgi:hypothetical protein
MKVSISKYNTKRQRLIILEEMSAVIKEVLEADLDPEKSNKKLDGIIGSIKADAEGMGKNELELLAMKIDKLIAALKAQDKKS